MTKHKHYECTECEGVFRIKHDMDDYHYKVRFCPFCGEEMDEDQEDDYDEDTY